MYIHTTSVLKRNCNKPHQFQQDIRHTRAVRNQKISIALKRAED